MLTCIINTWVFGVVAFHLYIYVYIAAVYGHPPPISKTIQLGQTRHAEHCWKSKDELRSDMLLWTPLHRQACVGWPARTYPQQLCADTGCSLEDLRWMIETSDKGESEKSMLEAQHDDNNNDDDDDAFHLA